MDVVTRQRFASPAQATESAVAANPLAVWYLWQVPSREGEPGEHRWMLTTDHFAPRALTKSESFFAVKWSEFVPAHWEELPVASLRDKDD